MNEKKWGFQKWGFSSKSNFSEEIARNAPCIRLVEYPAGKLHIVTICGARVGFGPNMDIQLESPSADGYSVEVFFN